MRSDQRKNWQEEEGCKVVVSFGGVLFRLINYNEQEVEATNDFRLISTILSPQKIPKVPSNPCFRSNKSGFSLLLNYNNNIVIFVALIRITSVFKQGYFHIPLWGISGIKIHLASKLIRKVHLIFPVV